MSNLLMGKPPHNEYSTLRDKRTAMNLEKGLVVNGSSLLLCCASLHRGHTFRSDLNLAMIEFIYGAWEENSLLLRKVYCLTRRDLPRNISLPLQPRHLGRYFMPNIVRSLGR